MRYVNGQFFLIHTGFEKDGCRFSPLFIYYMANVLYPEYFDYDVKEMMKDYCQRYFGITLTDDQAGYMLNGLDPEGNRLA